MESLNHVFVPATGQSTLGEIYQTIRWPKPFALATKFRTKYSVIPGFDGASEAGRSARLRIRGHSRLIQYIIKTKKTYNLDKKTLSVAISVCHSEPAAGLSTEFQCPERIAWAVKSATVP